MTAQTLPASRALAQQLLEIARVVESTGDETYRAVREDRVSGSVGAHVRHTVDHVTALLEPASAGVVDYDARRRGTLVEQHRVTATVELRRLALRLLAMPADEELASVDVDAMVDPSGRRVVARSTIGRELVFVLSHTIHHQAIIALLLASSGQRTPERFGLAPATPAVTSCAPSVS